MDPDYPRMLLAYHIRKEAMTKIEHDFPLGLSGQNLEKALEEEVDKILLDTMKISVKMLKLFGS